MGRWVADELNKKGHEVYGVDDFSGGFERNIPKGINFTRLDLRNEDATRTLMEHIRPDVIQHLAAHPHEGLSQFNPIDIFTTTCNASLNLMKAEINCDVKRFVFYSSMARYGNGENGKYQPPFDETTPSSPVDVYGAAKVAAETSLEALAQTHGMEYVILVPHNVAGEFQNLSDPYRNVLAIWINSLMRNKSLYIYGDGNQERSFSFIKDSLNCYVKCSSNENLNGEVINIGGGNPIKLKEAVQITQEEFGSEQEIIYVPKRPREVKRSFCTIKKSQELLGYEDKTDFRTGIREMITWAKSVGPVEPRYLPFLEIEKNVPITWKNQLI